MKYLTIVAGSLIAFFRATSLDFDSDAIVTAGFGLEKIKTIIHHFILDDLTMTKVDEEMKTAQLQADLILGGVLGTTLGPSP